MWAVMVSYHRIRAQTNTGQQHCGKVHQVEAELLQIFFNYIVPFMRFTPHPDTIAKYHSRLYSVLHNTRLIDRIYEVRLPGSAMPPLLASTEALKPDVQGQR